MNTDGKNVIFTDFFDTIMFRHIHPFQITEKMGELLASKGFCKDENTYRKCWERANEHMRKNHIEPNYKDLYAYVYKKCLPQKIDIEGFVDYCLELEEGLEIGAQYPNREYVDFLKMEADKGKKIYILSDYHLCKKSIESFLKAKNIPIYLFDNIFVSSELKSSKACGDMYDKVINLLHQDKVDVVMIGDNKISDGKNAQSHGIDSVVIPNYWPKIKCQVRRRIHWNYTKRAFGYISDTSYKLGSPYCEYSLIYYTFARFLYDNLRTNGIRHVVFLSREGHFLRRMFLMYESIHRKSDKFDVETQYMKCSRRASATVSKEKIKAFLATSISIRNFFKACGYDNNHIEELKKLYGIDDEEMNACNGLLQDNSAFCKKMSNSDLQKVINLKIENNQKALKQYVSSFEANGDLCLVDIGWKGNMQEVISEYCSGNTFGYYLGLNESEYDLTKRKGLIFTSCLNIDKKSSFSQILKTNIQLYEQLAAAPHGSAIGYEIIEDTIKVLEEWSDNEKLFYNDVIKSKQEEMLLIAKGLYGWCDEMTELKMIKSCAKTVLRSALFADKKRLEFLKKLDMAFFDNFGQETPGLKFDSKSVPISMRILYCPEEYTRYFAKIQRILYVKNKNLNGLYMFFARFLYWYVWGVSLIKSK